MNNTVNFNTATPQISFSAKKINAKKTWRIIDEMNNKTIELANKDKSEAEKKETAIRKSLEWIFKKLGFGKKLRNAGEEVKKQNKNINRINKIYHDYKLRRLAEKNPDEAREQIMRESMEDIGRFIRDI